MLLHHFDGVVHLLRGLPHRQAADGIAREVELGDALHVLNADIVENGALVDAEEHLPGVYGVRLRIIARKRGLAALQPAHRARAGLFDVLVGRRYLDALVKGHGDVAAEVGLYPHALLGPHEYVPPVNMRIEAHAVLADLAQFGEGKYLEAAAVREDGPVPGHEAVQPAEGLDEPVAGAHMQVIGVGELDLAADVSQIARRERALYRRLGADVHEHRRLHCTVRAGELPAPRAALRFYEPEQIFQLRSQKARPYGRRCCYNYIVRGQKVNINFLCFPPHGDKI